MVSMAVLIRTFSSGIHTHPVFWNCAYHLRMEMSDGGCFPNLVRNCRWTIVPRQSFWITLYFVNLYMFRAYLGSSWGVTTVRIQLALIILFRWLCVILVGLESNLSVVLFGLESYPTRTTDSHLKRIISTNCCIHTIVPPDDGPRYVRNM